jgi:hypothetical protein
MTRDRLAIALTLAGALPFWLVAAYIALDPGGALVPFAWLSVLLYGAVIASFVAGLHWGLYLYSSAPMPLNLFLTSIICALAVWGVMLLPGLEPQLAGLAAVFAVLFVIDRCLWRAGVHERWFYRLRAAITGIVIAALALLLVLTQVR